MVLAFAQKRCVGLVIYTRLQSQISEQLCFLADRSLSARAQAERILVAVGTTTAGVGRRNGRHIIFIRQKQTAEQYGLSLLQYMQPAGAECGPVSYTHL